jgi:hypothetical protein
MSCRSRIWIVFFVLYRSAPSLILNFRIELMLSTMLRRSFSIVDNDIQGLIIMYHSSITTMMLALYIVMRFLLLLINNRHIIVSLKVKRKMVLLLANAVNTIPKLKLWMTCCMRSHFLLKDILIHSYNYAWRVKASALNTWSLHISETMISSSVCRALILSISNTCQRVSRPSLMVSTRFQVNFFKYFTV